MDVGFIGLGTMGRPMARKLLKASHKVIIYGRRKPVVDELVAVGGKQEVFERCLPVFQALGKNITYMGESGAGQMTKLCNQVICALNIQAVCEGLMLGAKAGLDMEKLLSVVSSGAAGSKSRRRCFSATSSRASRSSSSRKTCVWRSPPRRN